MQFMYLWKLKYLLLIDLYYTRFAKYHLHPISKKKVQPSFYHANFLRYSNIEELSIYFSSVFFIIKFMPHSETSHR